MVLIHVEKSERTHTWTERTFKIHVERPWGKIQTQDFFLQGSSATHCSFVQSIVQTEIGSIHLDITNLVLIMLLILFSHCRCYNRISPYEIIKHYSIIFYSELMFEVGVSKITALIFDHNFWLYSSPFCFHAFFKF